MVFLWIEFDNAQYYNAVKAIYSTLPLSELLVIHIREILGENKH
jgi:hypothetical protein